MEYLSAIIALLAAFMGIIGNTWDRRAKGIHRVKRTGWCIIVIASIACIVSLIQTKRRQNELALAESNRAQLRTLAYHEINRALYYTEEALNDLYADYCFSDKQAKAERNWEDRGFNLFVNELPLTGTFLDGERTWGQYMSTQLLRTHAGLTSALNVYSPYLDGKVIIAVEDMRACEMFHVLLEADRSHTAQSAATPQRRSFLELAYYVPLASAYKKLRTVIPPE
jgi:hypothetical protein